MGARLAMTRLLSRSRICFSHTDFYLLLFLSLSLQTVSNKPRSLAGKPAL